MSALLENLRRICGDANVLTHDDPQTDLSAWEQDWRKRSHGKALAVVRPANVQEVADVVKACAKETVSIVPQGGNTGLVVGSVPDESGQQVVLSLQRMNKVRSLDAANLTVVAEAGCILQTVQDHVEKAGYLFPLSLAAEGSCTLGGNLGTNAGGTQVVRFGNTRELCLGLEVVTAQGEIWHGLSGLRKDNTGYDLRNLLIGSEGTLGVITAASLRLFPKATTEGAALMVVPDPAAALSLLTLVQARCGGVSAFELISGMGLRFLAETMPQVRQPFAQVPEWMVLIDLGLTEGAPEAVLSDLFEAALAQGLVTGGVIAQSTAQRSQFWALRETIPLANRAVGAVSSHDISLPLSEIANFIRVADAALAALGPWRINCFGHLGDGNLHYNVFPPKGEKPARYQAKAQAVQDLVHSMVMDRGGSFSAEHGIGRLKVADLERFGDPAKLAAMRAIKAALDPYGIMNPGAVLR